MEVDGPLVGKRSVDHVEDRIHLRSTGRRVVLDLEPVETTRRLHAGDDLFVVFPAETRVFLHQRDKGAKPAVEEPSQLALRDLAAGMAGVGSGHQEGRLDPVGESEGCGTQGRECTMRAS